MNQPPHWTSLFRRSFTAVARTARRAEYGYAVYYYNLSIVRKLAHRVAVMQNGRVSSKITPLRYLPHPLILTHKATQQ